MSQSVRTDETSMRQKLQIKLTIRVLEKSGIGYQIDIRPDDTVSAARAKI